MGPEDAGSGGTGGGAARRGFLLAGAISGGLAVAAGAFGAHALRESLPPDRLAAFETAARYQMFHALALLAVAALPGRAPAARPVRVAGALLVAGMILFSGSLYVLALGGVRAWGAVTPFGGICWLAAWALLAVAAARGRA